MNDRQGASRSCPYYTDTVVVQSATTVVTYGCATLPAIPAIVYIVLWAILKSRPTGGVIDV